MTFRDKQETKCHDDLLHGLVDDDGFRTTGGWRDHSPRGACWNGIALGASTVAASVIAGLLGSVAIVLCAVIFSQPVWGTWWRLVRCG